VFGSIDAPAPSKQAQGSDLHTTASTESAAHRNLGAGTNAGRWDSARILSPTEHAEAWTNRTRTEPKRGDHKLGPLKTSNKERLHRLRIPKAMEGR